MFYQNLKTKRNGTPSISFTPFEDPIPILTDKEIVSFPTIFIMEDVFKSSSASSLSMIRSAK